MPSPPSISVIIPAYNRQALLGAAIESVLAQSETADEILVIDDASTDGTADVARRYPVRLISQATNGGASAARNAGIHAASSRWVANLDSDDRWQPHHLATLKDLVRKAPEAVVAFADIEIVGSDDTWVRNHPIGRAFDAEPYLTRANHVPNSASLALRSALLQVGGFDAGLRLSEDYDLWLRLAAIGPFIASDKTTCLYRVHSSQLSSDRSRMQLKELYVRARHILRNRTGNSHPRTNVGFVREWHDMLFSRWKEGAGAANRFLQESLEIPDLLELLQIRMPRWQQTLRWFPDGKKILPSAIRRIVRTLTR